MRPAQRTGTAAESVKLHARRMWHAHQGLSCAVEHFAALSEQCAAQEARAAPMPRGPARRRYSANAVLRRGIGCSSLRCRSGTELA